MSLTFHFPYCFRPLYTTLFANAQLNQCKWAILGQDKCFRLVITCKLMKYVSICCWNKETRNDTCPATHSAMVLCGWQPPFDRLPSGYHCPWQQGHTPRESPCLALSSPVLPCSLYLFQTGHHPCAPLPFSHFQTPSSLPTN